VYQYKQLPPILSSSRTRYSQVQAIIESRAPLDIVQVIQEASRRPLVSTLSFHHTLSHLARVTSSRVLTNRQWSPIKYQTGIRLNISHSTHRLTITLMAISLSPRLPCLTNPYPDPTARFTIKRLTFSINLRHTMEYHTATQLCLLSRHISNTHRKVLGLSTITPTSPISRNIRWADLDQRQCMDIVDILQMDTCLDSPSHIYLSHRNNTPDLR
jgi:hypothetical protein